MKATAAKQKSGGGKAMQAIPAASRSLSQGAVDDRLACIATAAYYKAEARGFAGGAELADWLEAETEFDGSKGH